MDTSNKNVSHLRRGGQFITDPQAEPVTYDDVLAAMGMSGERIAAADLVGTTFTIIRAKPYVSSFDHSRRAYFCSIRLDGETEERTTTLGGKAIVDVIDEVIGLGVVSPLRVTLARMDGEKETDRYYYFVRSS